MNPLEGRFSQTWSGGSKREGAFLDTQDSLGRGIGVQGLGIKV